ncbi:MAG: cyclic-di-AMP receptor [Chloroflexota bacterium]|nr:cyclic-di-AMP receptor [Chloroflexota bacterium]
MRHSDGHRGEPLSSSDQKLLIVIAADEDADRLLEKMAQAGHPATKISSTGGFLRRGNATILSGLAAEAVDRVLAMVRAECQPRQEYIPVQALPFPGSLAPGQPLQVRVGGATVFVLDIERFEKV